MRSLSKTIAATAGAALVATSTPAAASVAPVQASNPNGWLVLSALSSSGFAAPGAAPALTACGAAVAAAAQPPAGCVLPVGEAVPVAGPPPGPPPPPVFAGGPALSGELLGLLIWLPLIAIALGSSGPSVHPNSPG